MKKQLKKMLRKVIHIIIALLLLITTAGFTISKHFCENRLVSVSMSSSSSHNDENSTGCCKDLTAHYQVKDDFNLKQVSFSPDTPTGKDLFLKAFNKFFKRDKSTKEHINVVKVNFGKGQPSLSKLQQYLL